MHLTQEDISALLKGVGVPNPNCTQLAVMYIEQLEMLVRAAYVKGLEAGAQRCLEGVNNAQDWDSSYWDQACENLALALHQMAEESK